MDRDFWQGLQVNVKERVKTWRSTWTSAFHDRLGRCIIEQTVAAICFIEDAVTSPQESDGYHL